MRRWLANGERNVVIPFAEQLADQVLALAVRQRRDLGALLTLTLPMRSFTARRGPAMRLE